MLKREDNLMIQEKRGEGVYIKDIAAELGVHPRTVRAGPAAGRRDQREAAAGPAQQTGRVQTDGGPIVVGGGVERGGDPAGDRGGRLCG